ncbi:zwei Ig domain protein zig-8-like [Homarus americanus]|uniref:zwei Ig domain protein zig-8-like n=1 Tax=Homarus americanus TaxID=6706 RepID=UPI001C4665C8|nr:zwei Ig domain protein zig-8-like [Homarus americanus]
MAASRFSFVICLVLACPGVALHRRGGGSGAWWLAPPRPYFTTTTPTNFTVISGQTAYLPCRVHMLGERSVTWMRGRDLHILTVGDLTYSADDRFQVLHTPETDDWTLQVLFTKPWDTGTYKCQVNSHPKIFRDVYLSVMDKHRLDHHMYKVPPSDPDQGEYGTRILGTESRYLQAGSSLVLECVVTYTSHPPPALLWYHYNTRLDYDSPRGGIAIMIEKTTDQTTSRLLLSTVRTTDSGNYTCTPINAPPASVSVHVTTDERQAAVQLGGYSAAHTHRPWPPTSPIILMALLWPSLTLS